MTTIDPGEGWRLLERGEDRMDGDELYVLGTWWTWVMDVDDASQCDGSCPARRRITPVAQPTEPPFDEPGDLRRVICALNQKIDEQAERDARLTHDRATLAAFIRHGGGKVDEVRRIVDEALGDRATSAIDAAMRRKIAFGAVSFKIGGAT